MAASNPYLRRRTWHDNSSMSSLASSLRSRGSLYTSTSSSTQWGPGWLAGKAVLAVGEAALRGAERLVILKRLATIKAHLPCDATHSPFMDRLFDDLLELSRPGLYPQNIRNQAMALILSQVGSLRTGQLIDRLSFWPVDDLVILVSEVLSICMFCDSGFMEPRLAAAYTSSLQTGLHPYIPCISFVSALSRKNDTTYEAVISTRFLDMLLLASNKYGKSQKRESRQLESLSLILGAAFHVLQISARSPLKSDLWDNALDQYWPFGKPRPASLNDVVQQINTSSPQTWCILEAEFLQHEVPNILVMLTPEKCPMHGGRSIGDEAYPRMKNLTLETVHPPLSLLVLQQITYSDLIYTLNSDDILEVGIMSSHALWHLMRCVALGGQVQDLMTDFLSHQSHKVRVSLLSRIIYLLIPDTPDSLGKDMVDLSDLLGSHERVTASFIRFLLDVTQTEEFNHALIDAVIVVVLPLLTDDMKVSRIYEGLFRRSNFLPSFKLRPSYCKATMRLFGIIKENRLSTVIRLPGSKTSQKIAQVLEPVFNRCPQSNIIL